MLNIDMPPGEMPSAVIVTTDSFAAATTSGRSASVIVLTWTAFCPVSVAWPGAGAWPCVAATNPNVDADARTAARPPAPTNDRRPREEPRRAGIVGAWGVAAAGPTGAEVGAGTCELAAGGATGPLREA